MSCVKCGSIKVRTFVDGSQMCSLCGFTWAGSGTSPTIPVPPILNKSTVPLCGFCGRVMIPHRDNAIGRPSFSCVHPDAVVHTTFVVP